jgi:hypothetical protein
MAYRVHRFPVAASSRISASLRWASVSPGVGDLEIFLPVTVVPTSSSSSSTPYGHSLCRSTGIRGTRRRSSAILPRARLYSSGVTLQQPGPGRRSPASSPGCHPSNTADGDSKRPSRPIAPASRVAWVKPATTPASSQRTPPSARVSAWRSTLIMCPLRPPRTVISALV